MSNYASTVSVIGDKGSVSLEGEYSNQLSRMTCSSINYIYVYLYNFIDVNLYNLSSFLSNIDNSIKSCQNALRKSISNIDCINGPNSTTCLDQIKDQITQCESALQKLSGTYGYINWLRIETIRIMSKYKDTSSFESKWMRLINAFSCSLTELNKVESCIICIKAKIEEILRLKTEFMNSINTNLSQILKPEDCKIKCLCDNIDALLASINNIQFFTYCLKCWICKFIHSSNTSTLSISQCVKYVRYLYHLFPLHPKTFQQLFYSQTLPDIKKFQSELSCFTTDLSDIIKTQNNSLNEFISLNFQLETQICCIINKLNENIKYLEKFNCNVTKCLKPYLCKYIADISNDYNQCHNSLLQNIETFEDIQKCVKTMETELNRTRVNGGDDRKAASVRFVKSEFTYIFKYGIYITSTFRSLKNNNPSRIIRTINNYLDYVENFLSESNEISKNTTQLTDIKNHLSGFSGYIRNYITGIGGYVIRPLSELKRFEPTMSMIDEIRNQSYAIKHKVKYCESSLKFELERLNSIWSNAKMIQNHIESIIKLLNNYKPNEEKLTKFKQKLEQIKQTKEKSISQLTQVARSIISYLRRIETISARLKCLINCVSINTIKSDVEYIKGELGAIQNIVSYVQSTLLSLRDVKFEVDCGTLNEIEGCIKDLVCTIHKKYCCVSSITSELTSPEECKSLISKLTLPESCDISKIQGCASTGPNAPGSASCQVCGTTPGSQACQCCQTNCQALQELISQAKSCEKNITQNLKCINTLTTELSNVKKEDNCQPSGKCQRTDQAHSNPECTSQSNTSQLIQCFLTEITKWQSTPLSCDNNQVTQCTTARETSCQSNTQGSSTTACQTSTQSSNSCKLAQVKLCLDTMINKCCCSQLKEFIDKKNNIETSIKVFKLAIIFNFAELFCLYLGFDKSLVDYLCCCMNKLGDMKLYMRGIVCIQDEINLGIACIKNEINKMPQEIKILENRMNLAINEMECAIEAVVRNTILCSLKSLSNHLKTDNRYQTGLIQNDPMMINYSILTVTNYNVVINNSLKFWSFSDEAVRIMFITWFCSCVRNLGTQNQDQRPSIFPDSLYRIKTTDINPVSELSRNTMAENVGNHLCLCLVIKYHLRPSMLKCILYLRNEDLGALSTISRKHDKYNHLVRMNSDLWKIYCLTLSIIYKILYWIKDKYKFVWVEFNYLREVKCFCTIKNTVDYHYLLCIILYLSSLIENIWAKDNPSMVTGIQSLSNLYSELNSYDFNSLDIRPVRCNKICGLVVNKECPGKKTPENCCCWCVACYNVLLAYIYLCFQFRLYKIIQKDGNCEKIKEFLKIDTGECKCPGEPNGCCLLKLGLSSELCNSPDLEKLLKECCEACPEEACCKKILAKVKEGQADLLVLGCKCDCSTEAETQVKAWCVLFNNPWGARSAAVVIVCKCKQPTKCCCLYESSKSVKDQLIKLCEEDCKCQKLTGILEQICESGCCEGCPCTKLKEEVKKICGTGGDCLCKKIDNLKNLCSGRSCPCKDKGCCRCVCCKLAIAGVRVLVRACRQNFMETYKRITIELLSGSQTKEGIMRSIVNSINSRTLRITYLLKNNYRTHFNTYTDHKNIANSFRSLTVGYGYDSVYEHQVAVNSCYMGINGIRGGYTESGSGRITKKNKLKSMEKVNVYTLKYLHTRVKTGNNIKTE